MIYTWIMCTRKTNAKDRICPHDFYYTPCYTRFSIWKSFPLEWTRKALNLCFCTLTSNNSHYIFSTYILATSSFLANNNLLPSLAPPSERFFRSFFLYEIQINQVITHTRMHIVLLGDDVFYIDKSLNCKFTIKWKTFKFVKKLTEI